MISFRQTELHALSIILDISSV